MKKDIIYTGYSATPSDYDCADGSLATAINPVPFSWAQGFQWWQVKHCHEEE